MDAEHTEKKVSKVKTPVLIQDELDPSGFFFSFVEDVVIEDDGDPMDQPSD